MIDKNHFTELTSNLYSLTLLFPKKDPLRYKIRGVADELLSSLVSIPHCKSAKLKNLIFKIRKDLEVLDSLLAVAKSQNWVSASNILDIQEEYSKIRKTIEQFEEGEKAVVAVETPPALNERQEKILEILREKKRIQIGELTEVFPEVSKRTLIRDLEVLMYKNLIERKGEGRGVFYNIAETS